MAPAQKTFHFSPEDKQKVHLDGEPKQPRWGMNEGIGKQPPHLAAGPDRGTVELQPKQNRPGSECYQNRGENRSRHVDPDEHRGYIDRIATHPRNRPIIIGRGDPEHILN